MHGGFPKLPLFRILDYCAGLNFSFIKNLSYPFPVYTLYCSKCEIPPHFEKILAKKFIILPDKKIQKKYCSNSMVIGHFSDIL